MREWYFQAMGQELGPLSVAELKAKVANGQIQPDTLIRKTTEGKWLFANKVKGLFAAPDEPPAVVPPPAPQAKSSATLPVVKFIEPRGKSGVNPDQSTKSSGPTSTISNASTVVQDTLPAPAKFVPLATMKLVEDDADDNVSKAPSVEFYHFVGFREAISPALFDAVEQFGIKRGISMTRLNRQALAAFIQRPELASDLMITAVSVIPQSINAKSNRDGSQPLSERQQVELATFRFTLFNCGQSPIRIERAALIPESVAKREYDTIADGEHSALDHTGHLAVDLSHVTADRPIPIVLDLTVPPQEVRDVVVWFYSTNKPSLLTVSSQFVVNHGEEVCLSEHFTILIHGDSPVCPQQSHSHP